MFVFRTKYFCNMICVLNQCALLRAIHVLYVLERCRLSFLLSWTLRAQAEKKYFSSDTWTAPAAPGSCLSFISAPFLLPLGLFFFPLIPLFFAGILAHSPARAFFQILRPHTRRVIHLSCPRTLHMLPRRLRRLSLSSCVLNGGRSQGGGAGGQCSLGTRRRGKA